MMRITGEDASFGSGLTGTDKTVLGICLSNGNSSVDNDESIAFTFDDAGINNPDLWGLVADKEGTLTSGLFNSSAIPGTDYQ